MWRIPILSKLIEAYKRIEYVSTYIIFCVIIALELITRIFPVEAISKVLSQVDLLLIILVVLLFMFRYMDDKFRILEGASRARFYERFDDAMSALLESGMHVETIDFVGSSSWLFEPAIESRGIKAKRVRIVLKNPKQEKYVIPSDTSYQNELKKSIHQMVAKWNEYKEKGYIENLEIHFCEFEPLFYAIILNGKKGLIGLFLPSAKFADTMTGFILTDRTEFERKLLGDLRNWFEVIFKEFSSGE